MKPVLVVAAALLLAFSATTGTLRSTHVWYVEHDGELLLEAGSPENGWFQDVQHNPVLTFRADGASSRYIAQPVADPSGHRHIRSLIRKKYGFRDRSVGLIEAL